MSAADARAVAARIVGRVVREGAYSNVVTRSETKALNPSDAGVARALAYDSIRSLQAIDEVIASVSKRRLVSIDPPLLDLVRVGVAELARGDRPDALAVDAIVRAAKAIDAAYAGFANGVLRAIGRKTITLVSPMPVWLDTELQGVFDADSREAFWRASMKSPALGLRGAFKPHGFEAVDGIDGAWLGSGEIPDGFEIQDPASVAVGLAVAAKPGERVLDMSAAPGGKTGQLVEAGATVIATDIHRRRTRSAARRVPGAVWAVADGTRPPFDPGTFDAVLVDAPCSGLGTLRRRPEIIHRIDRGDVVNLARLGSSMLDHALTLIRPGGRVVYSVCTVTPTETIDVVDGRGATPPELDLPGQPFGDGWLLAPHLGPTDGMFIAVIRPAVV